MEDKIEYLYNKNKQLNNSAHKLGLYTDTIKMFLDDNIQRYYNKKNLDGLECIKKDFDQLTKQKEKKLEILAKFTLKKYQDIIDKYNNIFMTDNYFMTDYWERKDEW